MYTDKEAGIAADKQELLALRISVERAEAASRVRGLPIMHHLIWAFSQKLDERAAALTKVRDELDAYIATASEQAYDAAIRNGESVGTDYLGEKAR